MKPREHDGWKIRRRFMFTTVAFCMGVIVYVLAFNLDTRSAETAVSMAFVILGTTVTSYVFGAAWEDISTHQPPRSRRRRQNKAEETLSDEELD